jgi:dephospho-CoA kinase
MDKLLVGLTGSIGSGKTLIANLLREFGVPVIDVDLAGKWVVENDPLVKDKLYHEYGSAVFQESGQLDRKRMADIAFASPEAMLKFNAIVHPAMLQRVWHQVAQAAEQNADADYIVIDAALIFELDMDVNLDIVVTVYASMDICLQRTQLRDNLSKEQIRKRMQAQLAAEEKKRRSDYVINNEGELEELTQKVKHMHAWLVEQAQAKLAAR